MSKRKLAITEDLQLPLDLVTMRTTIFGTSGSGKTTGARLIAERVHDAGQRFGAIDLKNDWFGLKSSADGKREGIPVVVFGGPNADVALYPDAGAVVADTVAAMDQSFVIDLDAFSKRKQLLFLTDFLERLYDVNRNPLLLILDEADRYAAQKPMSQEAITSLGAAEDIARRGRKRGIGSLWITQRTAVLNKNVSDICDLTIVYRTPGSRDLKELEERVGRVTTKPQTAEVISMAPGLEDGEAILLSSHPKLRKHLPDPVRPMQFPLPWTFDSSATPGVGQRRRAPKVLAKTDLAQIEERMKSQIDRAKEDDPKHLKQQLAELRKQLTAAERRAGSAASAAKPEIREVPLIKPAELKRIEAASTAVSKAIRATYDRIATELDKLTANDTPLGRACDRLDLIEDIAKRIAGSHNGSPASAGTTHQLRGRAMQAATQQQPASPAPRTSQAPERAPTSVTSEKTEGITARQQRFLDAAAALQILEAECTRQTVAGWVGVHPRGGSVGEELKALADAGMITLDRGRITVTSAGLAAAGDVDPSAAIESAKAGLKPRQRNFFDTIVAAYPGEISREDIAQHFNLHPRGGSLGEDLAALVGRGLVTVNRGIYRARDFLFAGTSGT